jgi:hypothetical protein
MTDRVALLPGRSAYELARDEQRVFWIGWLLFALAIVCLPGGLRSNAWPITTIGIITLIAAGLSFSVNNFSLLSGGRRAAERAAGYTTAPIPYDPDVPLALPKSGLIVRAKGAPPLDSTEYKRLYNSEVASTAS